MKSHVLGFPRIGSKRELKFALEAFWKQKITQSELEATASNLRKTNWQIQHNAGLDYVCTGDFSFYDQILDMSITLGVIPERFQQSAPLDLQEYFKLARGDAENNIPAMEMTKWFNTNYHYIVPEISTCTTPRLNAERLISQTKEAIALGFNPKPVIVGPLTYLSLSKGDGGYDVWEKLPEVLAVYCQLLKELAPYCQWIQIDEPILCADVSAQVRKEFAPTYERIVAAAGECNTMLATYFDNLDDNLDLAVSSGCSALHIDLVRGQEQLGRVLAQLPETMLLSVGIVDGRNIWKTDYVRALKVLEKLSAELGSERLWVGSSCSLLHTPVDLLNEVKLDPEIRSWLAFAVQKCHEIKFLSMALAASGDDSELRENIAAIASRRNSSRVHNPQVKERLDKITPEMLQRQSPYAQRKEEKDRPVLPEFPTTTIGSFPQTKEIRQQRLAFKKGEIGEAEYNEFIKDQIGMIVRKQEELGLDVLVHGEPERNDMVEYFGQQLAGFCFTDFGWVQSYGSRCVKPPVIFGDISRPAAMTVEWLTYAQSLTDKPLKGMLTGPVTILCWSFIRDDLPRETVCKQLALAIRDEVLDLEQAGIRIIQIDEAALSEGMPVKQREHGVYLEWAVDAFRLATTGVTDSTQIHTHMCYSKFNTIIESIAAMDADVISIESSRSKMRLLDCFRDFEYPNEIGPGVWDIHSPRIPSTEEIISLLKRACEYIPRERIWVNPDCGLKTRDWPETIASITNMVAAAKALRTQE